MTGAERHLPGLALLLAAIGTYGGLSYNLIPLIAQVQFFGLLEKRFQRMTCEIREIGVALFQSVQSV